MTAVAFDQSVGNLLLRYARMLVARGYVHNSLGNLAIRVPHPEFEHGLAYTKHAEVSLEEMTLDNVVITDIPTPALLYGTVPTSVGHNLNREILRLRPDVRAVIHAHHDETIALFASGALKELRVLSLEFPYVMAKPPYVVPSHLDVEQDVGPVADFIQSTNSVIMEMGMVSVGSGATHTSAETANWPPPRSPEPESRIDSSKVATSISIPNWTFGSAKYPSGRRWFRSEAR